MDQLDIIALNYAKDAITPIRAKKLMQDIYIEGFKKGVQEATRKYRWTAVKDRNPDIDMSYTHSDDYLIKYNDGEYDVVGFCNWDRSSGKRFDESWWSCDPYRSVEAWMPIPKYSKENN